MSEVLARLTPAAIDIEHIAGGFAALSSSDIAYCLSGLDDLHQRYAMHSYVYADTDYDICTATKADRLLLFNRLVRIFISDAKLNRVRAEQFARIHILSIKDGLVCQNCNGQKEYRDSSGHKHVCYACEGTGYNKRSQADLCRMGGIDQSNWKRRHYDETYFDTCRIVTQIKQTIDSHIRRLLQ